MQAAVLESPPQDAPRRATVLELSAAGLLAASVILHLIALIPQYYGGSGQSSLWSEPDQAAQYAVLAAGWALVLAIALTGPGRARLAAALAIGMAATEFGFRLSDLGEVFRYGPSAAAPGLWLMTAAWVVGAGGAVLAVLAARASRRESRSTSAAPWSGESGSPTVPLAAATGLASAEDGRPDPTESMTVTSVSPASPDAGWPAAGSPGVGLMLVAALLALATAGAFLPAWDHYTGVATTTGRTVSFNLGNAFSGPWQVVIGTVVVAVALAVIPVLAVRMRSRAVAAALVAGSLFVLATQFVAAVVQVDRAVSPSVAGLSPTQANQLGLQLHMTLTGWFTFDLLAGFALFVAAMVFGHIREVESEPGARSTAGPRPS
jgi:hypothetical protein